MVCLERIVLCVLIVQGQGMKVRVQDEVFGLLGGEVTLRCQMFGRSVQVTRVSWFRDIDGQTQKVAVYNQAIGLYYLLDPFSGRVSFRTVPPSTGDAALLIRDLLVADEGNYTCEFKLHSNATEQGQTSLQVTVRPQNHARAVKAVVNNIQAMVVVAICSSENGRPTARLMWNSSLCGDTDTSETRNINGTITITSRYKIVPTVEDNGTQITCIIIHRTSKESFRIPVVLHIQSPNAQQSSNRDTDISFGVTAVLLGFMIVIVIAAVIFQCQNSSSSWGKADSDLQTQETEDHDQKTTSV